MPNVEADILRQHLDQAKADADCLGNMLLIVRNELDAARLRIERDQETIGKLWEINAVWMARALKEEGEAAARDEGKAQQA